MIIQKAKDGNSSFLCFLKYYSLLWLSCAILIYVIFKHGNKSFLWILDGVYQHFVSFNYLCDYISNIATQRSVAAFNYTLGQGADILTTLNSYDFTDPVSFLCALCFPLERIQRYNLMVFLKLYLAGFSFGLYCYVTSPREWSVVLAGALAYTFSGVILYTFARHPNYANWAYFFPFLVSGLEVFFSKKKRAPLVIVVFLNIITSYYTFYINSILVAIYVIVGSIYNVLFLKSGIKTEIKKCFSVVVLYAIGVLLSSFVLLPTISAYLSNPRMMKSSGYNDSLFHYEKAYYITLYDSFFAPYYTPGYYTFIGLNVGTALPLTVLFIQKGENTKLKALLVISMLMLCLPFIGRFMNGMGYASNRWSYVIAFYGSLSLIFTFDELATLDKEKQFKIILVFATYILVCLLLGNNVNNRLKVSTIYMLIWAFLIILLSTYFYRTYLVQVILVCTVLGSVFQIVFTFSSLGANYISTFLDRSQTDAAYNDYSSVATAGFDEGFFRVEEEENKPNKDGFHNINGTSVFWSLLPSVFLDYYSGLDLSSVKDNCFFNGLDGRTGLLELASVKYYTRPKIDSGLVPYGYKEIESSNSKFQVFENLNALPIGYTYSGYMPRIEYDKLSGLEKEQALLQGAVLDVDCEDLAKISPRREILDITYEIIEMKNINLDDRAIEVTAVPGTIILNTNLPEQCEIYLYYDGLELIGNPSFTDISVTRSSGDYYVSKEARISNINYSWPVFRDAVAINLGYGHGGANTIAVHFNAKAKYSLEAMKVIAIPMALYEESVKELRETVLEKIEVESDRVSGSIYVPSNRLLQFSIPYSKGWTAFVDGEKTDIIKSDIMYMAVLLKEGKHTIELDYRTPLLNEGIIVSGLTFILWLYYEIIHKKNQTSRK